MPPSSPFRGMVGSPAKSDLPGPPSAGITEGMGLAQAASFGSSPQASAQLVVSGRAGSSAAAWMPQDGAFPPRHPGPRHHRCIGITNCCRLVQQTTALPMRHKCSCNFENGLCQSYHGLLPNVTCLQPPLMYQLQYKGSPILT